MTNLVADLLLALDPVAFAVSLGIIPDAWQAQVLRSASRRLLLNCSRLTLLSGPFDGSQK